MNRTAPASPYRKVLLFLGVIAAAAAAGYTVTCAIFPAPILARTVSVPAFRGMPIETAIEHLTRLGLRAKVADTVADPLAPTGSVAWQSPVAETFLPKGAVVRLALSSGPPLVSMPDVTDLDIGTARQVIEAAGLVTGRIDTLRQELPAGTVLATTPSAGATMRPGDLVSFSISTGPATIRVPDVVGLTVAAARERIVAAGLRVVVLTQKFEGKAGTILAQSPGPGEMVTKESGVNLTISGTLP
ncbi:MAG: PASTA domain-containing protein [Gemmatimonadota bacterium]